MKDGSPAALQQLTAAAALPTGSQEDEEEEGGEEDAEPEDAKQTHILNKNKFSHNIFMDERLECSPPRYAVHCG